MDVTNVDAQTNQGRLRHLLTSVGGAAAAHGFLTQNVWTGIVGGIMLVVGFALSEANKNSNAAWAKAFLAADNAVENNPAIDDIVDAVIAKLPVTTKSATLTTTTLSSPGTPPGAPPVVIAPLVLIACIAAAFALPGCGGLQTNLTKAEAVLAPYASFADPVLQSLADDLAKEIVLKDTNAVQGLTIASTVITDALSATNYSPAYIQARVSGYSFLATNTPAGGVVLKLENAYGAVYNAIDGTNNVVLQGALSSIAAGLKAGAAGQ